MRITVRLFATLRDRAQTGLATLDVAEPCTVSDLMAALAARYPLLADALPSALAAVNQEYASLDDVIADGDEVAFFPPVSGGAPEKWPELLAVTEDQLDLNEIAAAITQPETGAVAIFSGIVRAVTSSTEGEARHTSELLYEAYAPMAHKTLQQVAAEIRQRFARVQGIAIIQRLGRLEVGTPTVVVACSAGHRHDGIFEAALYGINRLKEIVPVWKQEIGPGGTQWIEGDHRPTPTTRRSIPVDDLEPRWGFFCPECGASYPLSAAVGTCQCGEPLEVQGFPRFATELIAADRHDLWRYRALLAPPEVDPLSLGEAGTPLIETALPGHRLFLKMEGLNPTGSFKDRGAALLVSMLHAAGIRTIHDDSSGNAGAALAAYAARAGIDACLYVPASAAPAKLAQIQMYGARLVRVEGPRSAAADAARAAADRGDSVYASHILHPFSVAAYKSLAYEVWEQLDHHAPDAVVSPAGHGSQILGLWWGFGDLHQAGLIARIPRLIAVQASRCAPLWQLMHAESRDAEPPEESETIAEGIRIAQPVRWKAVLRAIRGSGGTVVAVSETDILDGLREMGRLGIGVEPTSAVIWPALKQIRDQLPPASTVVVSISGSGLKTPPAIVQQSLEAIPEV